MLRVGLTGGISTGKSSVGRIFADLGCHVLESDAIGHDLLAPGQSVYAAVAGEFGPGILQADGSVNRKALGDIVFSDPARRRRLNQIMHPEIIRQQAEWLARMAERDPQGIGIVEAALMIEVGTYRNYDKLIVVVCSVDEQIRRLRERSHLSEEEALARISSQIPMEEKVKYADYVVDTSGSHEETRQQVESIYSKLRRLAVNTSPDVPHASESL